MRGLGNFPAFLDRSFGGADAKRARIRLKDHLSIGTPKRGTGLGLATPLPEWRSRLRPRWCPRKLRDLTMCRA